mmetsp:Transcript_48820/g.150735  ORF Transcript_48820/g.150735 Transcript_48820/m.150735 type:complete len:228 (+) Transcript_48820:155-838(+)
MEHRHTGQGEPLAARNAAQSMQAQRWPHGSNAWDLPRSKQTQHSLGSFAFSTVSCDCCSSASALSCLALSSSMCRLPSASATTIASRARRSASAAASHDSSPPGLKSEMSADVPPASGARKSSRARRLPARSRLRRRPAAARAASSPGSKRTSLSTPNTDGWMQRLSDPSAATTASKVCTRRLTSAAQCTREAATRRTTTCVRSSTSSHLQIAVSKSTCEWAQRNAR